LAITQDVLVSLREILLANWTCQSPSSTTITAGGFVTSIGVDKFTGRRVVVFREAERPVLAVVGSSVPTLTWDFIRIAAVTQDKTELDYMLRELRRIMRAKKIPAYGGIDQIDIMPGGRVRKDMRASDNVYVQDIRVRLWYEDA